MRSQARVWVLMVVCGLVLGGVFSGVAQAASFGIENFVAVNCEEEECAQSHFTVEWEKLGLGVKGKELEAAFGPQTYYEPNKPTEKEAIEVGAIEAGQRVPDGITDFKVNTEGSVPAAKPAGGPVVKIRTDVPPGLATNPTAVHQCSFTSFDGGSETEIFPGTGFYPAPTEECEEESEIGENKATVYVPELGIDLGLSGIAYNLEPPVPAKASEGLASDYGVALKLPKALTAGALVKYFEFIEKEYGIKKTKAEKEAAEAGQYYAHTLIEGNVEWGKQAEGTKEGDYHDYFKIKVSKELPLISSRLVFYGTNGQDFITNATACTGHNVTTLKLTDESGVTEKETYKTPVALKGCNTLKFEPTFELEQANKGSDQPDPLTAVVKLPQDSSQRAQSQVRDATITLPPGMTLNPSAAYGLQDCTEAQARINSEEFGVSCPEASKVGTVSLEVPTLPAGSLKGDIYLGGPDEGSITGAPSVNGNASYTMYVVANSERYGVSVRLKATAFANETTGQVTTVFEKTPEQPFTSIALHFERGVLTAVANPLVCGTPEGSTSFTPAAEGLANKEASFGATITGCASTLPFSLSQSSENEGANGGGNTSWTYALTRPEGNQYLQQVKTTLPPGLVGNIPDVTLCAEAQAAAGTCTNASKIGTVKVEAGSGSSPYVFNGNVYMTGPYDNAPFGLSIVVPAVAGPFNLGNVVSRATINVNPSTAQVTSLATLPTIVKGIPVRLRSFTVSVGRQGFLDNPTNCSAWNVESELTSTEGAVQKGLDSAFQVANCGTLSFAPKFAATTSAKTSRADGASLVTTLTQGAGQANIKYVKVQLPRQLPSRLSTLNKACTEAQFNTNPEGCPAASKVGTAKVVTPTLNKPLTGRAIFVSHGGAAFPDLDLVVEGEGVRVILVGNTEIKSNVTTTTFASTPDVPVSSVTVNLPTGPYSALAAYGDVCRYPLLMPTTITGQNGKVSKSTTKIAVSGCGVKVIGHKVVGNTAYLTIKTFAAGRISGSGSGVSTVTRSLGAAHNAVTLKVPLSSSGRSRRKPLKVKIRVGFVPKKGAHSVAYATVTFR